MKALLVTLLSAAMQIGPPTPAEKDQEAQQPQAAPSNAGVEQTSGKTEPAQRDDTKGLYGEIKKLSQLQNEIRALLDAARAYDLPEDKPEPDGTKEKPDSTKPAPLRLPPVAVDMLAAADALYLSGEYAGAFALYAKAKAEDDNTTCWISFQKGNCLRWLGRVTQAVNEYQRIVTEHPDNFWAQEAEWWIEAVQWKLNAREE